MFGKKRKEEEFDAKPIEEDEDEDEDLFTCDTCEEEWDTEAKAKVCCESTYYIDIHFKGENNESFSNFTKDERDAFMKDFESSDLKNLVTLEFDQSEITFIKENVLYIKTGEE